MKGTELFRQSNSSSAELLGSVNDQYPQAAAVVKKIHGLCERDNGTGEEVPLSEHCRNVTRLSVQIGRRSGFNQFELDAMTGGGYLHDVGKPFCRGEHHSGVFTEQQRKNFTMRHVLEGVKIIDQEMRRISSLRELIYFQAVRAMVRYHHHPGQLRSRVLKRAICALNVCDRLVAMCEPRTYHEPFSVNQAVMEIMTENQGPAYLPDYGLFTQLSAEVCRMFGVQQPLLQVLPAVNGQFAVGAA